MEKCEKEEERVPIQEQKSNEGSSRGGRSVNSLASSILGERIWEGSGSDYAQGYESVEEAVKPLRGGHSERELQPGGHVFSLPRQQPLRRVSRDDCGQFRPETNRCSAMSARRLCPGSPAVHCPPTSLDLHEPLHSLNGRRKTRRPRQDKTNQCEGGGGQAKC